MRRNRIKIMTISLIMAISMGASMLIAACGSAKEPGDAAGMADQMQEAAARAEEAAAKAEEAAAKAEEAAKAAGQTAEDAGEMSEAAGRDSEGNGESDADEPDWEALYAPVLKETLDVARNGYDSDREYQYVSTGLMEKSMYPGDDDLTEVVGYTITDVSGDGIPELLIGIETEDHVTSLYSIHTLVDDQPVFTLDGWARNYYIWLGDGHYENTGSNGAMSTLCGECHLSKDGTEIEWDDFYFSDEKEPGVIGFYHNTTGFYDINAAEELDISEDEFRKILEQYEERYTYLPMTPIGEASTD
ncbi:MAG: hypothetical protein IKN57_07360 [Parasporobacterium sp.]|nr:hypothetical protein [Parasporobacterium sp.]